MEYRITSFFDVRGDRGNCPPIFRNEWFGLGLAMDEFAFALYIHAHIPNVLDPSPGYRIAREHMDYAEHDLRLYYIGVEYQRYLEMYPWD